MSRSRKKTPIIKMGGGSVEKTAANRKIRHSKWTSLHKGNLYKKFYPQYDVIDYTFYCSRVQAKKDGWDKNEWEAVYYRK